MVGGGQCLLYQEWSEYWAPWVDRGWSSANSCCRHSELLSPSEEAPGGIGEWWRAAQHTRHPPQPASGGQARGGRYPCVPELRKPQQEARGHHPAAGHAGAAALLSALLGALPQHPAHLAALQAGPGRVQVRWATPWQDGSIPAERWCQPGSDSGGSQGQGQAMHEEQVKLSSADSPYLAHGITYLVLIWVTFR